MEPVDRHVELVNQFWAAPDEALFSQKVLAEVTDLSEPYFERARWEGDGPKYFKLGRLVRYKKKDVLAWIEKRPVVSSTSEGAEKLGPQFGAPGGSRKKREQARGDAKQKALDDAEPALVKRQRKVQPIAPGSRRG